MSVTTADMENVLSEEPAGVLKGKGTEKKTKSLAL